MSCGQVRLGQLSPLSSHRASPSSPIRALQNIQADGMRPHLIRRAIRPPQRLRCVQWRLSSTQPPPPARPYRPQTEEQRAASRTPKPKPKPEEVAAPRSPTRQFISRWFNPFHEPAPVKGKPAVEVQEPRDPARGIAAAQRVVTQGMLDPRYKAHSRRWIAIIIGLVIAIGLSPEVWRRTMKGEKRKEIPGPKHQTEGTIEGEGEGMSDTDEP